MYEESVNFIKPLSYQTVNKFIRHKPSKQIQTRRWQTCNPLFLNLHVYVYSVNTERISLWICALESHRPTSFGSAVIQR